MCGIFGVIVGRDPAISAEFAGGVVERLFLFSETRGREAAGLALFNGTGIDVLKQAGSASDFVASSKYRQLMGQALANYSANQANGVQRALAITGHSRLVTNGLQSSPENNQPVVAARGVGIHNGIIVNDAALWERHGELEKRSEVDTEVLINLVRKHFDSKRDIAEATRAAFGEIEGS